MSAWRPARRRLGRPFHVAALVALLGALVQGAPASAVAGFQLRATASAVTVEYRQPNSPVPTEPGGPTFEAHLAFSFASLSAGSGHGLASVAWPGSFLANAPGAAGNPEANYSERAETFYPQGPEEATLQRGPTTSMRSTAAEDAVEAFTTSLGVGGAAAGQTAQFTSGAKTSVTDEEAEALATATASNLVLGEGLVTIGAVITEARAVTDGVKGRVEGTTVVSGVKVGDQEVTVDGDGVHIGGETVEVPDALGEAVGQLEQLGVTIRVAGPVDELNGAAASRTVGGLVVELAAPSGESLTYRIAGVRVGANAAPGVDVPDVTVPPPPPVAPPAAAPAGGEAAGAAPPAPPSEEVVAESAGGGGALPATGLPVILVAIGTSLAVAASWSLRRLADRALLVGAATSPTICPLGKS